uniref:Acireductone dioxygenase n=1 Tax=Angiostrongylus cantonensis TaxID=6313 RepID=A0A0K0DLM6_ANGCA
MPVGAYFMGTVDDPRDDCRMVPNREATSDDLANIGVEVSKVSLEILINSTSEIKKNKEILRNCYFSIDMTSDWEKHVDNLMTVYGMNYRDEVQINRASMPDFDERSKKFYEEHLHRDPEVRFIKSGTGFFDVRSIEDEWIRIPVGSGDFLSLPAGIYHRFTTDRNLPTHAKNPKHRGRFVLMREGLISPKPNVHAENLVTIRMFQSAPKWISYARCKDGDEVEERSNYLKQIRIED